MKNVSILSKLFLVSALVLPCGQAFGMKGAVKGAMRGTAQEIKIELEKQGFLQWPSVNACKWGLVGAGGSAFYYGLKNLPEKKFKTVAITLGFGAFGYLLAKIALNGGKLDKGFKQTLKNQKTLENGIKQVDEKVEDEAKVQKRYTAKLFGALAKLKLDNSILMKMNLFSIRAWIENPTKEKVENFIEENGIETALREQLNLDPKQLLQDVQREVEAEREKARKKQQENKRQQKKKSGWFGFGGSRWTLGL